MTCTDSPELTRASSSGWEQNTIASTSTCFINWESVPPHSAQAVKPLKPNATSYKTAACTSSWDWGRGLQTRHYRPSFTDLYWNWRGQQPSSPRLVPTCKCRTTTTTVKGSSLHSAAVQDREKPVNMTGCLTLICWYWRLKEGVCGRGGVIWATISICITLPRNSKDLSAEVTRLRELIIDKTNHTHTKCTVSWCREMGVVVCEERGGARGVSQFWTIAWSLVLSLWTQLNFCVNCWKISKLGSGREMSVFIACILIHDRVC